MNFFILYLILLTLSFYILNETLKKKKILIDNINFSEHKKFTGEKGIPYSGGIFFLLIIFYLSESSSIYNLIIFALIFLIGLFSDLNKITSASKRIIFQSVVIISYILVNDIVIIDTRLTLLDNLLNDFEIITIFFTFFCIIVLINGTNFIDGLNNLASGYYFVIFIILIFLNLNNPDLIIDENFLHKILLSILVFLLFNFFSLTFLGDSGAYLLAFFCGFYLIEFYNNQINLSPYFIVLIFWYPAYENLFSIIRRFFFEKKKVKSADNFHLHQLLFKALSNKFKRIKFVNSISGLIINFFNFILFFPAIFYYSKSNILIILLFVGLSCYNLTYLVLRFKIKTQKN